ncbi:translation initiation factor IF-3 [Candidatus Poribacteria bacterium]|nr:translation initiation factor IF-3 [Candidatus Poribacteria bacterium]
MAGNAHKTKTKEKNRILNLNRIRLIDNGGNQVGIVSPEEAFKLAWEEDLDLVEVAPDAEPPVIRIMDYGKYKYKQSKREKAIKQSNKLEKTKEIKLSPSIGEHDYNFKKDHAEEFLQSGSKTIFTIPFKGREVTHPELGREIMQRLVKDLSDIGDVISPPRMKGRFMSMVMAPQSNK